MSNNELSIHAKAVNLARRLSASAENDLLQEPFVDDPDHEQQDPSKFTKDFCKNVSQHLIHLKDLHPQCMQYADVVADLKKRDKDTSHPTQWLS